MSRFIFTNTDSGAGCLKQARIVDRVVGLGYDLVHGPAPGRHQYLRVFVGQLRAKIEVDPAAPTLVLTEPGIGYRLIADE